MDQNIVFILYWSCITIGSGCIHQILPVWIRAICCPVQGIVPLRNLLGEFLSIIHSYIFFFFKLSQILLVIIFFRILVADGRYAISASTLMKDVNLIYSNLGLKHKITSKSAKSLGVSSAFRLGMSDDHIRVLGRLRSIATAQHYRAIDDTTLIEIFSKIMLKSSSTAVPRSLAALTDQASNSITSRTTPSWSSAHSASLNRALIFQILLASGYLDPQGCPLNNEGYPLPQDVPEVRANGEELLAIESSQTFIVTLPN